MKTEEMEDLSLGETKGDAVAARLYDEAASVRPVFRSSGKVESLPSLTITDSTVAVTADGAAKDTVKPGEAAATWMASLKPAEMEAAKTALKEAGVTAGSPEEINAECKKLVKALESDDYATREIAKATLRKAGAAALPSLLAGMGSEDAHVRRECSQLAGPYLRPAGKTLDALARMQDVEAKEAGMLQRDDQTGVDEDRLKMRKDLLDLPAGFAKDEAAALQRVKALVEMTEKECAGRKTGATLHEARALSSVKDRLADQEEAARKLETGCGEFLARTAGLLADPGLSKNGVDYGILCQTVKRALDAGAKPDGDHMLAAMAQIMHQGAKRAPADVLAAFKKAGGKLEHLPPANALDKLAN